MTAHTPGPWVTDDDYCIWRPQDDPDDQAREQIAVVESRNPDWPSNALLIAAAPELLSALEALSGGMNSFVDSNPRVKAEEVRQARAAIALAKRGDPVTREPHPYRTQDVETTAGWLPDTALDCLDCGKPQSEHTGGTAGMLLNEENS